jgi:hypothetical protein
MIIKKGDYTFCGDDTRPHRWALKIKDTLVQLRRLNYEEFCSVVRYEPKVWAVPGQPDRYYVADDGLFATFYPPADQDYELVQLSDKE